MSTTDLIQALSARNWQISTAESCTGGLIGGEITSVAGASKVYAGGIIAYTPRIKTKLLNVPETLIAQNGVVSEAVARAMAEGAAAQLQSEMAIAVTGVAGPGADGDIPEGRVCFGFVIAGHSYALTQEFGALGREAVRRAATEFAIKHATLKLHII